MNGRPIHGPSTRHFSMIFGEELEEIWPKQKSWLCKLFVSTSIWKFSFAFFIFYLHIHKCIHQTPTNKVVCLAEDYVWQFSQTDMSMFECVNVRLVGPKMFFALYLHTKYGIHLRNIYSVWEWRLECPWIFP